MTETGGVVKKSRFTEEQIAFALKQAEPGTAVPEICRKMGMISDATFYNWKKKYGGLGPSELKRLRQLEEENRKLKQLVADLRLDKAMLQEEVEKKSDGSPAACLGEPASGSLRRQRATSLSDHGDLADVVHLPPQGAGLQCVAHADSGDRRKSGALRL